MGHTTDNRGGTARWRRAGVLLLMVVGLASPLLASPAAGHVSGNLFVVWGKTVRVMEAPKIAKQFTSDDVWTPESIDKTISSFLDDRRPVADGFGIDLLSEYWRFGPFIESKGASIT